MGTRFLRLRDIDATNITRGLWQGGLEKYEDQEISISDVDHVIFLALDTGVSIVRPDPITFDLQDAASDLDYIDDIHAVGISMAEAISAGDRVACFCRQGRNRSSLASAAILYAQGWSGKDIIKKIRSKRRNALSTPAFEKYLKKLP